MIVFINKNSIIKWFENVKYVSNSYRGWTWEIKGEVHKSLYYVQYIRKKDLKIITGYFNKNLKRTSLINQIKMGIDHIIITKYAES